MTAVNALSLDGGIDFEALGVWPLDNDEMASIAGGTGPWVVVAYFVLGGVAACAIGVAVGTFIYWAANP